MKLSSLIIALALVPGGANIGRTQETSRGSNQTPLASFPKVDQLFAMWDRRDSPGCALGVIKDGRFVYRRGYGMANLEHGVPIDLRTIFYIASMSKQFTAMSIALLARRGKLSLDDDIRKHLPEMPPYQKSPTVRDLIYHTSGIRDFIVLKYLSGFPIQAVNSDAEMYETMAQTNNQEVLELIARQRELNFTPGEEFAYSNSNYLLLGEIVKRVSGKSLAEFADENIFQPLGMVNTHYSNDLMEVIKDRATGYTPVGKGFAAARTNNGTVGPAGLMTSVEDLLLWDRNFYQNQLSGGDPGLLDVILTPGRLNDGSKLSYAFGLVHYKYKGLEAVGHDGGFFGFKTSMNRFPSQKFTVICLCNVRNAPMDGLADQVADIYLTDQVRSTDTSAALPAQTVVELTEQEPAKYAGIYWNPVTEGLWMLFLKDGRLVDPGGGGSVLVPIGKNRFQVTGQPVELIFETPPNGGHPVRMLKVTRGGKPQVYEAVKAARPALGQLAEYAGRYTSDEIDAAYTLIVHDGTLTLTRTKGKNVALTPTFSDNFWNDEFGYVKFTRDRRHKINGLLYTSSWIRRLRFSKT
ncbi:MAG: serine hydrolase domain-containing protein [Acidobacteriota bacterium]